MIDKLKARSVTFAVIALGIAALGGCAMFRSPYDYLENWLIREDPVRAFMVPADVIYVQNDLYESVANVSIMHSYARSEVGNGRFDGIARVFSPLVATEEDLSEAVGWYFANHHERNRLIVFIGEGKGGEFLQRYERLHRKSLVRRGLVASFYTPVARKGFVTAEMVDEIKAAIERARYRHIWGREMPDGMQQK